MPAPVPVTLPLPLPARSTVVSSWFFSILLWAGVANVANAAGSASVQVGAGRTTAVQAALDVGSPVERAVPGRAYGLAVIKDREARWNEAAALYQQAIAEWSAASRARPSPALERAVQKAERERQRSQTLAGLERARPRPDTLAGRVSPVDEARLYRTKLMVVRAFTGTVPAALYARARNTLEEALRAGPAARTASQPEIQLLLCATHAAAGYTAAARLARAHVSDSERDDAANALPMAVCAAALGENEEALARLQIYILRPAPNHADPYTLRDLYVANDWDRLRGDPRFEALFR